MPKLLSKDGLFGRHGSGSPRGPTGAENGLGAACATTPPPVSPQGHNGQVTAQKASASLDGASDSAAAADSAGSEVASQIFVGAFREYGRGLAGLVRLAFAADRVPVRGFHKCFLAIAKGTLVVLALCGLLLALALLAWLCYAAYVACADHTTPAGLSYLLGGSGVGAGVASAKGVGHAILRWHRGRPPDGSS
jgi:hypothetical protein